mmetsp:Transcript_9980/g.30622  ORF Transcript_9980/g.30622 Transcript_9980/m.30622 type:complete len:588 (-) Transcript_9980:147-1910(-)
MTSREPQHGPAGEDQPDQSQSPPLPSLSGASRYAAADDSSRSTIKCSRCGTSRTSNRSLKDIHKYHCSKCKKSESFLCGARNRRPSARDAISGADSGAREMWFYRKGQKTLRKIRDQDLPKVEDVSKVCQVVAMDGYITSSKNTVDLVHLIVKTSLGKSSGWYVGEEIGGTDDGFEKAQEKFFRALGKAEYKEPIAEAVHNMEEDFKECDTAFHGETDCLPAPMRRPPRGSATARRAVMSDASSDTSAQGSPVNHGGESTWSNVDVITEPPQAVEPLSTSTAAATGDGSACRAKDASSNADDVESVPFSPTEVLSDLHWPDLVTADNLLSRDISEDMVRTSVVASEDLVRCIRRATEVQEVRRSREEAERKGYEETLSKVIEFSSSLAHVPGVLKHLAILEQARFRIPKMSDELRALVEAEEAAKRKLLDKFLEISCIHRSMWIAETSSSRARGSTRFVRADCHLEWHLSADVMRTSLAVSEEIVRCMHDAIKAQNLRYSRAEADRKDHDEKLTHAIKALEKVPYVPGAQEQLASLQKALAEPPETSSALMTLLEAEAQAKQTLVDQQRKLLRLACVVNFSGPQKRV